MLALIQPHPLLIIPSQVAGLTSFLERQTKCQTEVTLRDGCVGVTLSPP